MSRGTEHQIALAVERMADRAFEAFLDQATAFSCGEIESIAAVYRAIGWVDSAAALIDTHSLGDDEGDEHFPGS